MQMLSTALVDRVKADNNRKKQRERERECENTKWDRD